jgi:hypothetical protein
MKYEFVTQTIAAPRVQLVSRIQSVGALPVMALALQNQNLKHIMIDKLFHVCQLIQRLFSSLN